MTMTPISERQCARFNIYKKQKKRNIYIYVQKARHFAKSKTISVTVLFKKNQTLRINIE